MKKRIVSVALGLCLLAAIFSVCKDEEDASSVNSQVSEPIVERGACDVSKMYENEEWVVDAEGFSDEYSIPQFNVYTEETEKVNKEILDSIGSLASSNAGYVHISYRFYNKDGLVSVLISLKDTIGEYEYRAYNLSLTDGTLASNEAVVKYMGFTLRQFRNLCVESLRVEYNMSYASFEDSLGDEFKEMRSKTTTSQNLDECVPYLNQSGKLYFTGYIYNPTGDKMMVAIPLQRNSNAIF